jgi:hypothetical protein
MRGLHDGMTPLGWICGERRRRALNAASFYGAAVAGIGVDSAPACRMSEMLAISTTSRNPRKAPKPTMFQPLPWYVLRRSKDRRRGQRRLGT